MSFLLYLRCCVLKAERVDKHSSKKGAGAAVAIEFVADLAALPPAS